MRIIVDAMGGDHAPSEIIKGSLDALKEYEITLILVGKEEEIEKELNKYDYPKDRLEIINADQVISNDDDPALAIRRKKDSSMVIGLRALNEGVGDGFLSAGNTGALLAGGTFISKRIKGIERAALTTVYPTSKGLSLLLDAGANVDSKPEYLEQFALMGSIYMEKVRKVKNPKVGLVNVGSEESKGDLLTKEAFDLIKKLDINFIGNVEGRDLAAGQADVIVCDGFVGNVILKTSEGVAISLFDQLKEEFLSSWTSKLAAFLMKDNLKKFKAKMDYREYGGAPLLGIRKPVVKAHGSSDAYAIKNAVGQVIKYIESGIIDSIEKNIS